jgi:succinate dehydrogenase/fumarate reductase flavoprotein subunit
MRSKLEVFSGVPRTGKTRPLRGLLYGLKIVPGITFTMGGVLINGHAQVLNSAVGPIRGLYAAGTAIGGLMGGFHDGYTGGITQAIVTGMLAGESAASFMKQLLLASGLAWAFRPPSPGMLQPRASDALPHPRKSMLWRSGLES